MLNQNPMSVMAQASKLSITQLQQAVKNGTIPPYIGVPLLQQKIKESQQAKQAMTAQQPPQPPIAQQVMQQAESQGVDTLPSNLPVQGMAGGGIIAFDEGGEVPRFAQGGKSFIGPISPEQFDNLAPSLKQEYVNQFGAPPAKSQAANPIGVTPRNAAVQAALQGTPMRPQIQPPQAAPSMVQANPMAASQAAPAQDIPPPAKNNASLDDYFGSSGAPRGAGTGTGSKGIAGYEIKKYDDSELRNILNSENNPDTGKPYTFAEITDRNKKQATAAGIDQNIYKSQREDLDKLKEKYTKGSKLDEAMPFFAAAEALTRPTKTGEAPPSFIGSLASGLGAYGRTAGELTDKQEARLEKIRSEGINLTLAQNAFNQAQYAGDKTDFRDAKNAEKTARMNLANLGVKNIDQQNELAKTVYETQVKERIADKQIGATIYSANKAQNTIQSIAKTIKADNPTMSNSEALKKAYEISNPGFARVTQVDIASQRTAITKAIGDIQKQYPMGVAMPAEVKAQLATYNKQLNALTTGDGAESAGAASGNTVDFSKLPK